MHQGPGPAVENSAAMENTPRAASAHPDGVAARERGDAAIDCSGDGRVAEIEVAADVQSLGQRGDGRAAEVEIAANLQSIRELSYLRSSKAETAADIKPFWKLGYSSSSEFKISSYMQPTG